MIQISKGTFHFDKMKNQHLHIHISQYETDGDLVEIRFKNDDFLRVNFSKLVSQSKYFRDKYKYSEALYSIQIEIEKIEKKFQIKDEIIKLFIQLVQDDDVNIPIDHYKDFYALSEYFNIPNITAELDKIREQGLFKDLNFSIQILIDSYTTKNGFDTKLTSKIENFLSNTINECFENAKFRELPFSTISRIIEKSDKKLNHNLLIDFILESAETRFVLLKFVELDKLKEDKIDELIGFFDEQEENSKKKYLEYLPFNLSFIKMMRNKYNTISNELNQTKEQLKQEKINHEQTNKELKQEKINHEQTREELNQEKINHEQTKEELRQEKINHDQTKKEINESKEKFNQERISHEQTKEELNKCKNELKQAKNEYNRIKNEMKQHTRAIFVGGYDQFNGLGEKPNNKSKGSSYPMISPPVMLSFDPSPLLSYSSYFNHTVLVTRDGLLKGIGNNKDYQIASSLEKRGIDQFTDFCIKDGSGRKLNPVSAVCYRYGTLYMLSKMSDNGRQLVLCDCSINGGEPVFLDIGDHQPVALFGGWCYSAAICSEGEVIFINRNSIKKSPKSRIASVSLPDGEKASSVACCDDSVSVLSSNGRVFQSPIEEGSSVLMFSEVVELKDKEIVCVSGANLHILAVSKEGRVFGCGSNDNGRLGLEQGRESSSSFTMISSLEGYEIRAAYAGGFHSLFETKEGKILSCGYNYDGQLLLNSGPGESVYSPTETMITGGATFCIAGSGLSVVFIGDSPPPNTPNTRVQQYK